jgi:UrcA family protein
MKTPTSLVTLLSAFAVAVLVGPGIAYGEEVAAQEPASDVSQHIYAVADAIRFDEVSVTVPFADLNLNNEKGAAVLYRRLQIASESICGTRLAQEQRCLRSQRLADDCYHRALTTAVESAGSEILLSLHRGTKPAEMYAAKAK